MNKNNAIDSMKRVSSIDVVRGVVMIIMALDHTRDFIHVNSLSQQPTDMATTNFMLFFTRWITHLCAPSFVFLSGVSAYISFNKKKNYSESQHFLITRGLSLILFEFTIVNFGLWFDINFNVFLFNVLGAIGFGFIVLSLLLRTSLKSVAIVGLSIIFLHNLVPAAPTPDASLLNKILMLFFNPGAIPIGSGRLFVMGYPPIPWLGIMLIGFASGKLFEQTEVQRKSLFLKVGLASIALFILIRGINIYGDPLPWALQQSYLFTFLSFLNVTKYGPSLVFCLVTLGLMFLMLSFVEGKRNKITEIATVYGKAPLFYFLVHWYIIHPIMFLIVFLQGYKSSDLLFGFNMGRPSGPSGLNLFYTYLIWISVVIILYPLCKWYGSYKERNKEIVWLRYL